MRTAFLSSTAILFGFIAGASGFKPAIVQPKIVNSSTRLFSDAPLVGSNIHPSPKFRFKPTVTVPTGVKPRTSSLPNGAPSTQGTDGQQQQQQQQQQQGSAAGQGN